MEFAASAAVVPAEGSVGSICIIIFDFVCLVKFVNFVMSLDLAGAVAFSLVSNCVKFFNIGVNFDFVRFADGCINFVDFVGLVDASKLVSFIDLIISPFAAIASATPLFSVVTDVFC